MTNKIPAFLYVVPALILFLFTGRYTYAQTAYIQHFTTRDGLPSNNCFYALQDSKGYIWIGTDAGVSRFDGRRFENFSMDDGLSDNQILQLKEDKMGRIWFLSLGGQLSYFFNGKIFNESNDRLLKILKFNAIIISFFEDSKGRMWFGTNKNLLFRWDGKHLIKYRSKNLTTQFINTFIHEDAWGKIWAFSKQCVHIYSGSKFTLVPHMSLPISHKTILNLSNKKLLYLAKNGLYLKNGPAQKLLIKINPSILHNDPGYFYASKTELWLSNSDGIFQIKSDGKNMHYLSGIDAGQILKDTKDNMWFTTKNGIYMLPKLNDRLYIINKNSGLSCDGVKSITKDNHDRLWLGLDHGNIHILNPYKILVDKIEFQNKKKYNRIKQLSFDTRHQSVYFASDYGFGVISSVYSSKKKINYLQEAHHSAFVVKGFSINDSSQIALALSSGVLLLKDGLKTFNFSNIKEGLSYFNNRSYHVYYDQQNRLWFSNINGLSKFSEGKQTEFYRKNQLLTKRVNDIKELNDGTVVLATDGYGLIFMKGDQVIKQITRKQGLANNICKKLFIKDNMIWVVTNNGINRLHKNGNQLTIEAFEYTNSLLKNDVNDLYIDSDTAYFATNMGLVYFYNKPTEQLMERPKVLISSILINNKIWSLNSPQILLAPSDNNITFRYNAVDFQNQEMSFRYRLKSDANWTETKNRRIEFSALSPGTYKFELSGKTNNSEWSAPVSVDFILKAHFWQTTWFLILSFLIGGLILYKIAVVITKSEKNKEQQKLLLKNKILMLEQRALQAMMNPHFVFNVMNSIQHYINTKDHPSANKILTGFARLIRKNLEICTKSYISLEEEIEYLELYLSLEKKRFGGKFKYNFKIDPKIDKEETLIPSMLLQPYIENAIWHGIMPKEEGGEIDILIDLPEDNYLLIRIIDNGLGINNTLKNKISGHDSKGMSLTLERINLLNQIEANPIQVDITQNGDHGTTVAIRIPSR